MSTATIERENQVWHDLRLYVVRMERFADADLLRISVWETNGRANQWTEESVVKTVGAPLKVYDYDLRVANTRFNTLVSAIDRHGPWKLIGKRG